MSKLGALYLTKHTGPKHTATVIFLHGSGAAGDNMKEWVDLMIKNFSFPHIKVLYPTAPLQPYTPSGGYMSNVWFDRSSIALKAPEKSESIDKIRGEVMNLIENENQNGIASNRIVVGGFSMGGSLTLHTAYRWDTKVAGAFVFSSFLNEMSDVYKDIKSNPGKQYPPLLQIHGDSDELVDFSWGQGTFNRLKELGVQGEFHKIERLGHSLNQKGMRLIKNFIEDKLPEN